METFYPTLNLILLLKEKERAGQVELFFREAPRHRRPVIRRKGCVQHLGPAARDSVRIVLELSAIRSRHASAYFYRFGLQLSLVRGEGSPPRHYTFDVRPYVKIRH